MALEWVQLVGHEEDKVPSFAQDPEALSQYAQIGGRVFKHLYHRDDIERPGSKWEVFANPLQAGQLGLKRAQVVELYVSPNDFGAEPSRAAKAPMGLTASPARRVRRSPSASGSSAPQCTWLRTRRGPRGPSRPSPRGEPTPTRPWLPGPRDRLG